MKGIKHKGPIAKLIHVSADKATTSMATPMDEKLTQHHKQWRCQSMDKQRRQALPTQLPSLPISPSIPSTRTSQGCGALKISDEEQRSTSACSALIESQHENTRRTYFEDLWGEEDELLVESFNASHVSLYDGAPAAVCYGWSKYYLPEKRF